MECEYCHKILRNKSSLNVHQKKTKACLKIQGNDKQGEYVCECGKDFHNKQNFLDHQNICKIVNTDYVNNLRVQLTDSNKKNMLLERIVEELKKDKEELKKDKEKLMADYAKLAAISANKSTTTNNTTNNLNLSVFDKTPGDIKRIVDENYNFDYFVQGQKGVAKFTHVYVLKGDENKPPMYLITDKSRGNGKYKNAVGEIVSDIGMCGLTRKIHPSIKEKARIIASDDTNEMDEKITKYLEISGMDEDNCIFRNTLIQEMSTE